MTTQLLLSRKQAALALSLSLRTIDYLIDDNQLLTRRVRGRVLIPYRELEKFSRRDHPTPKKELGAGQ